MSKGHTVTGYNRTVSKAQPLVDRGLRLASSPRAVAAAADVTFVMVANSEALRAVATGPDGFIAGAGPGKTVVDMSTVSPALSRELAMQVREQQARMVDAPVSGSVLTLEQGRLSIMVGGERETFDRIKPLLEVETEKAVVEVEAPGDGILASITAHEGAVIPVGRTIAWLVQPGEAVPAEQLPSPPARFAGTESLQSGITSRAAIRNPQSALSISPKARRLAKEHGIDLSTIKGSGPGGEILASDIVGAGVQSTINNQSAISNPQSAISSASRLMAERTTQSWTTAPHFFLSREVDATALNAARNAAGDVSHTDLLVSLVARALAKHPRMNASWVESTVRSHRDINVAIAIAVDDAVVIGVIHGAERLSPADIASRRKELVDRARAGKLQPADIAGATFTISNLGMYQVDAFTAVIVPPQAGILAVGAIADRVVAVNGQAVVRPTMTLTLCCDHRVVDGARGAAFLNAVVEAIRNLKLS